MTIIHNIRDYFQISYQNLGLRLCLSKTHYWLSILFVHSASIGFGQVVIPVSHLPRIGDTFVYAQDTNPSYVPKPLTNGVYDFSDLKNQTTVTTYYASNDNTLQIPKSNLRLSTVGNTQSIYFNRSSNDLFILNISAISSQLSMFNLQGLSGNLSYLKFPMTSTTSYSGKDTIAASIPASILSTQFNIDSLLSGIFPGGSSVKTDSINLNIEVTLDAKVVSSGKIKTPIDNNLDVLKFERIISFNPKIFFSGKVTTAGITLPIKKQDITSFVIALLPIQIPNLKTHTYISASSRQEILNANVDSSGKYQMTSYRLKTIDGPPTTLSVQTQASHNIDFQFYDGYLTLEGIQPKESYLVECVDLSGKLIQKQSLTVKDNRMKLIGQGYHIIRCSSSSQLISRQFYIF